MSAIGTVVRRSLQRPVDESGGDVNWTARSSVAGEMEPRGQRCLCEYWVSLVIAVDGQLHVRLLTIAILCCNLNSLFVLCI